MWKNVKEKAKGASRDSQQSCILPGSWLVAHGKLSITFLESSCYTVSVFFVRSRSSISLSLSESMCTLNLQHKPHVEQNIFTSKKEDFVRLSWHMRSWRVSVSSAINTIFSIGMRRDELDIDLILCSVGAVLAKCGIIVGEWHWRRANAMNTGAGRLTTGKNTSFLQRFF